MICLIENNVWRVYDMIKAKVTSKNQLTIPKKVIDYLGIIPGDKVTFTLDQIGNKKCVSIERLEGECPVCKGEGNIEDTECIVCQGSGQYINEGDAFLSLLKMTKYYRLKNYRFSVALTGEEIRYSDYSIIELKSNVVIKKHLDIFRDFYYVESLKQEYMKHNKARLSDEAVQELIDYAYTEQAKKSIMALFLECQEEE
jgi:AbrB family looped-hinge helix DNA binding protein